MSDAKENPLATNASNIEASIPAHLQTISAPKPTQIAGPIHDQPSEEYVGIDVDCNDDDSAIGGFSDTTPLTSARSSVYDFITKENGRRYHRYREGKYMLPNDEHHLWLVTLRNQLSLAPLKKEPDHVLDVGTGTGIWALEYAIEHPASTVIGSDLSPIQPDYIPLNCSFEVDDLEDEWLYLQKFDLIHGRALVSCLPRPQPFFQKAFAALAPGGYFEMQDVDFPSRCDDGSWNGTALKKWYANIYDGFGALGRDMSIPKRYKEWMIEAGFVNVEEKLFYWPTNTWPKDPYLKKVGLLFNQDLLEIVEIGKPVLTGGLKMSQEEVEKLVEDAKKDIGDRRIHVFNPLRVVIGMKPEEN